MARPVNNDTEQDITRAEITLNTSTDRRELYVDFNIRIAERVETRHTPAGGYIAQWNDRAIAGALVTAILDTNRVTTVTVRPKSLTIVLSSNADHQHDTMTVWSAIETTCLELGLAVAQLT